MYPAVHARNAPDRPAVVMAGSGETISYRELDERSNRLARLLWSAGLRPGDGIALFLENHPRYFEAAWAGLRSGLYVTPVNSHLGPAEAAYIVNDCGARALVTSSRLAETVERFTSEIPGVDVRLVIDGEAAGFESYEGAVARHDAEPLPEEPLGELMLYSSGTTGQPKGIRRPISGRHVGEETPLIRLITGLFGFDERSVYLSPAPLYHAAPLRYTLGTQAVGGTVVVLERFEPEAALAAIEAHRVTHSQWVPTMFIRMLRLPEETRARYDLSSLRIAIHAAAPCPVPVKRQMLEWWGPVIHEYYAASEGIGFTWVGPEDWLRKPGTVGKAMYGTIHVVDDEGRECGPGEPGTIWFESRTRFEYHGDAAKTADAYNEKGWSTVGDVGYVDEDGDLFLTDRKAFMIIAGGVNIYPREIEDVLVTHPKVADVAVFGVPNPDLGEEVKAVVQPLDWSDAGPALAEELTAFCSNRLARYKCPRSIDFDPELPRLPTGKLYKRVLRDRYWR